MEIDVKAIAKGYTNLLLNRKEELSQKRLEICKQCPAYEADYRLGARCNPHVQIKSEVTGDYVYGCSCILSSKTRSPKSECPAGRWLMEIDNDEAIKK